MDAVNYKTIRVRLQEPTCFIQLYRPDGNNSINETMIAECREVLRLCEKAVTIVVIEGLPQSFCLGADLRDVQPVSSQSGGQDPQYLYELWQALALGPFVSVAYVRGRVSAGGVGFVAASDIVLADGTAVFALSELLFGLCPACVWPFLVRRVGFQRAQYLALTTQSISAEQAQNWGLVDMYDPQADRVLQRHLVRLKCLSKAAIRRYKEYVADVDDLIGRMKSNALRVSRGAFSDADNVRGIRRYVDKGLYPWER